MLIAPKGGTTELIKDQTSITSFIWSATRYARSSYFIENGDDISTDGILKAGAEVLPLRSNIPEISNSYYAIDPTFYDRAIENQKEHEGYCVIAGDILHKGQAGNML
jgi:aconitate hydratase